MPRINKILLTFLLLMVVAFGVVWKFVQSESFAKLLSNSITKVSKDKFEVDVEFEKLAFKFFPPGAELYNVKLKRDVRGSNIKLEALRAGVTFDLLDSFETDLTIKKVYLYESKITLPNIDPITSTEPRAKSSKINPKKALLTTFNTVEEKLPFKVRNVQLVDMIVKLKNDTFYIRSLDSELNEKQIDLFAQVDDLFVGKYINTNSLIDRLTIDASFNEEKISLRNLNIKENYNNLNISGLIEVSKDIEDTKYELKAKVEADLPDVNKYINFSNVGEIEDGTAALACELRGKYIAFESTCLGTLKDFDSDFAYGESAQVKFEANNERIRILDFNLIHSQQKVTLLNSFELYNFKNKHLLSEPVKIEASGLKFNNALRILRKQLSPLSGEIFGELKVELKGKDLLFSVEKGTYVTNLSLKAKDDLELIGAQKLNLENANFEIIGTSVYMDINAMVGNTKLNVRGGIADSKASFHVFESYVDFDDLNKVAGFAIKGHGPLDLTINSPIDMVLIRLNTELTDFNFEDYQLEKLKGKLDIDLANNTLSFKNITGKQGRSSIQAKGAINLATLEVGVEVNHPSLYYNDLKRIYFPLQKNLNFLPKRFLGEMNASMTIGGKASLEDLKIFGKLKGKNLYVFNESFDSLNMDFILNNKFLNFRQIDVQKSSGKLLSIVGVDLNSSEVTIRGNIKSVPIGEVNNFLKLPIQIKGKLDGSYYLVLNNGINRLNSQLYITNSNLEGTSVGDSYVDINYDEGILRLNGQVFEKVLQVESSLNLTEQFWSMENESFLNAKIDIDKIEKYLPIVDGINDSGNLRGRLSADVQSSFNYSNLKSLTLSFILNELMIKKSKVNLHFKGKDNEDLLTVEKGQIKKWDVDLRGDNIYLISKAGGNFLSDYEINSKLKVEASILEVFDGFINQSSGILLGKYSSVRKGDDENYEAILTSNNLALSADYLPIDVKSSKIKLSYKNKKIDLDKFLLELGSGSVDVSGSVNFQNIIPELSLKYQINQAEVNLLKKTLVEVSGNGAVIGSTKPYTINGDLLITKAQVLNEFTEFKGGDGIATKKVKYLPESSAIAYNNLFSFNVSVVTQEPVRINNSMAELAFTGNVQLLGSEVEPRLSGKIGLSNGENKLVFQNNEFKISRGDIYFSEVHPISDPEIDFVANSTISKYNISARVYGPVSEYNTSLTSDPVLPQQNILSLIAFGYTEDVSDNLSDVEKESITRAGIGSLIFESFKINQALKNEFGVQVNLGTEISRDEGSYLSQRGAESTNNIGRVRSATKIEIKKEITKDVSMSVTSTVGGTSGERQSMNLNYNINNIYSIEGVYQSQTSDEDEQDLNDNSFGADFKIKWSFK